MTTDDSLAAPDRASRLRARLGRTVLELASLMPPVRPPGGIPVLCYHRIYDGSVPPPRDRFAVTVNELEAHLAAVQESDRTVVPLTDLEKGAAGSVLLTFDDNLSSHIVFALPVLRAVGITATFYLSPADLGAAGRLSHHDVQALLRAGMFVGAHGNHHIPAVRISPAVFRREVEACRTFLQGLGMPLTWAYPGGYIGSFRDYHEQILLDHGFTVRFTTLEGVCRPSPLRVQSRYVVRQHSSARYVRAALHGGLQLVSFAKRIRGLARQWRQDPYELPSPRYSR